MALIDALHEWERLWAELGLDTATYLNPGLPEDEVRRNIDFAITHPDTITWFGWHNGAHEGFNAYPAQRHPWPMDWLLKIRSTSIEIGVKFFERDNPKSFLYHSDWMPLLYDGHGGTISMDQYTGEMWRYATGEECGDDRNAVLVAPDLETLVRIWIEVGKENRDQATLVDNVIFQWSGELRCDPHLRWVGIVP